MSTCNNDVCTFSFEGNVLEIKKLSEDAQPLTKSYDAPACIDIPIIRLIKVDNGIAYFGTGYAFAIPEGYYVQLHPRSSMPKMGVTLANCTGIIDWDYTGEIIIALQPSTSVGICVALKLTKLGTASGNDPNVNYTIQEIDYPSANEITQEVIRNIPLPAILVQFCLARKEDVVLREIDTLPIRTRGDRGFGSSNK